MKNLFKMTALLMAVTASMVLDTKIANAATPGAGNNTQSTKEEQEREERIRYNLRQGAFNLNGGIYTKNQTPKPLPAAKFAGLSENQLRDQLQSWGVTYLFQLNERDLQKADGAPFFQVEDLMGNATAESRGGNKFRAQVCKDQKSPQRALAARFERNSAQESNGGYLLVKESDPSTTNLSAYEGFSMGAWVQLDQSVTGGTFPILSKSPLNQVNAQGKNEWSFWVTGNVVYLNISRQGRTQNISFNMPWWGDRFGACYERGVYRECWHYIALSFEPTANKLSVLFLRKFANKIPEPAAESFFIHETNAQENALPIETSTQTPLRIGASNAGSMNGILKGVFFARKALAANELKAMAQLTEPKKDGLFCNHP